MANDFQKIYSDLDTSSQNSGFESTMQGSDCESVTADSPHLTANPLNQNSNSSSETPNSNLSEDEQNSALAFVSEWLLADKELDEVYAALKAKGFSDDVISDIKEKLYSKCSNLSEEELKSALAFVRDCMDEGKDIDASLKAKGFSDEEIIDIKNYYINHPEASEEELERGTSYYINAINAQQDVKEIISALQAKGFSMSEIQNIMERADVYIKELEKKAYRSVGIKHLIFGIISIVLGIILTIMPIGRIFIGLLLVGAIEFFRGIYYLLK